MAQIKRKISYYSIEYTLQNGVHGNTEDMLGRVLDFLNGIGMVDRRQEDPRADTITFLAGISVRDTKRCLLFKSARHDFRPPLVKKTTLEERANPKEMDEGETMKTHVVIDLQTLNIVMENARATTIKNVVKYLNLFLNQLELDENEKGHFDFCVIPSDTFRTEFNRLTRIASADMYVEKQVLGSPALNYSNRLDLINEEITISVKAAKRGESIKDFFSNMLGIDGNLNNERIKRIRLRGKDENDNDVLLDSLNLAKKEYVTVAKNEDTGEVDSEEMFNQLCANL